MITTMSDKGAITTQSPQTIPDNGIVTTQAPQMNEAGTVTIQSPQTILDNGIVTIQASQMNADAGTVTIQSPQTILDNGIVTIQVPQINADAGTVITQSPQTIADNGKVATVSSQTDDEDNLYVPADTLFDANDIISESATERRRFWYFKTNKPIQTDDFDVEMNFNELDDDEFAKIQTIIVNGVSNFKEIFGLPETSRKRTLQIYLFNNKRDYAIHGTKDTFKDSFGLNLHTRTFGLAVQNPYMLFTTKDDFGTLIHEMAHALNYYAIDYKAHCLWDVFIEGLADYFELLHSIASWKSANSHISHAFDVMVNAESRKDKLDEIKEALSSDRRIFNRQNVNIYAVGYALVTYLQEKHPNLIKEFFNNLSKLDYARANAFSKLFAKTLHNDHDRKFKEWLRNKYNNLDDKMGSNLHEAARDGSISRVRELINQEADINSVDTNGWTPLHFAAVEGHLDIVKYLVDKGANIHAREKIHGRKPIHNAAHSGYKDVIDFFLNKGISVNEPASKYGWTLMHYIGRNGKLEVAKYLVEKGINVNVGETSSEGGKPIHIAAQWGKNNIIEFLLSKGVSVNEGNNGYGWTLLHYASNHGQIDTVKFLHAKGANMNPVETASDGRKPIHVAANRGYKNVVEFLICKGVSINEPDTSFFKTPLHYAMSKARSEVVIFLIDKGANVNARLRYGSTPLHFASYYRRVPLELAALLILHGADIEAKIDRGMNHDGKFHKKGSTPIDIVKISGKRNLAQLMNEKKAQGNSGWSPLHYACKHGNKDLAVFMVEHGANSDAKDKDGKTPLDIAIDNRHDDIVIYLEHLKEERMGQKSQWNVLEDPEDEDCSAPALLQPDSNSIGHYALKGSLQNDEATYIKETVSSGASRQSSWISSLFKWVNDSTGKLFDASSVFPKISESSSKYSDTADNAGKPCPSQFSTKVCMSNNIGLAYFLLQSFLDKKCPIPQFHSATTVEVLTSTLNITRGFENVLMKTAEEFSLPLKDFDFFQVHLDLANHIRSEKYSKIPNVLYSAAKEVCKENVEFMSAFKQNIDKILNAPFRQAFSGDLLLSDLDAFLV